MSSSGSVISIKEFYIGRSVFITGGTGFLGKVLIEKLLRSCPGIKEIFVLMRPKKNMSIDDRLRCMLELPLFDILKKERPDFGEKIIPVYGDISSEGLGLGTEERRFIAERVSVIFHVAANVRFDDSLKHAIFVNTRSTRDVCILAHEMKNLVALVHVSSTYAHSEKGVVDEIVYPPLCDWKKMIKIAENVDEEILRVLTAKIIGAMSNTYTFTKRLAEQVIVDYSKDLPSVIYRPSIVISCATEPLKGWVDNFNGPVGLMVGGGKGILRICFIDPLLTADFMPVDIAIKAMITASWRRGLETVTKDPKIHVYNCAAADVKGITNQQLVTESLRINQRYPLEGIVWWPNTSLTSSPTIYYIKTLIYHLLPALLIDRILVASGKTPMVVRLQRKVYISNCTLSFFLLNEWKFRTNNFRSLLDLVPEDTQDFVVDLMTLDPLKFLKDACIGGKVYLLREDMKNMDDCRKHLARMWWVDRITKVWFLSIAAYISFYLGILQYFGDILGSVVNGSFMDTL